MNVIPHNSPFLSLESDLLYIAEAISRRWVAQGDLCSKVEQGISTLFDSKFQVKLVTSGTAALYLALLLVRGCTKRKYVVIPTYACNSLASAVYRAGFKPMFLDVNLSNMNLSTEILKQVDSKNDIAAIINVHTFGSFSDASILREIIPGALIIDDCAHTIGVKFQGNQIGHDADFVIYSFGPTKPITGGIGGAIAVKDEGMFKRLKLLLSYDDVNSDAKGFNFSLSDINAGLILSQMGKLEFIIKKRQHISKKYQSLLSGRFRFQQFNNHLDAFFYRVVIFFDAENIRNMAAESLRAAGVSSIVPITRKELLHIKYKKFMPKKIMCTNSEFIADHSLSLPIYPSLTDSDVEYISDILGDAP